MEAKDGRLFEAVLRTAASSRRRRWDGGDGATVSRPADVTRATLSHPTALRKPLPQVGQQLPHVGGKRAFKTQVITRHRMHEAQLGGVKHRSRGF